MTFSESRFRSLLWPSLAVAAILAGARVGFAEEKEAPTDLWETCRIRGLAYAECGQSASRLLHGWIDLKQDPKTQLFSRGKVWNYHNEAADHYSSLVLMAHFVAPECNKPGDPLYETLTSARGLCSSDSGIPVTYDLRRQTRGKEASYAHLSEWLRDGLIRIVEVTGTNNPWYEELVRLTDAMIAEAPKRGGMAEACRGLETSGNMLQTLARLNVMSGNEKYLSAAEEIADPILLEGKLDCNSLRLLDHGCELVPGLAELFVVECRRKGPKAPRYRSAMRELLDKIIETAAHPTTGLFVEQDRPRPPDTWGYVLFAHENYDLATGEDRYRHAIEKPLRWLLENRGEYARYRETLWPNSSSSDDWSDSYESMIILAKRYPSVGDPFPWLDWATRQHVHRRTPNKKYGPYTGGHFDGSTGRTLCIHLLMSSQGVHHQPFQEGVRLGGLQRDGNLLLRVDSDRAYRGRLCFDRPRNEYPSGTIDWARLNEVPQWFVARPEESYVVSVDEQPPTTVSGNELIEGFPIELEAGQTRRITVATQ